MNPELRTVWAFPAPSQEFERGPVVWHHLGAVLLQYDYETPSGEYAWREVAFTGVVATRITHDAACDLDRLGPLDEIAEVLSSPWVAEVRRGYRARVLGQLHHYRAYFDSIGCYEFVAEGFEPRGAATQLDPAREGFGWAAPSS